VKSRILVVEDEGSISEPLAESLARDGFEADRADLELARRHSEEGARPDPAGRDAARR
jgi:DNA-binding response OmpR family regulator